MLRKFVRSWRGIAVVLAGLTLTGSAQAARTVPLEFERWHDIAWDSGADGKLPVYRYATYGEASLEVTVESADQRRSTYSFSVGGPDIHTLEPRSHWRGFRVSCTGACARTELRPKALLARVAATKQARIAQLVEKALAKRIPDADTRSAVLEQWRSIVRNGAWDRLDRFPVLPPLNKLTKLRPLLGDLVTSETPKPAAVIQGVLTDLMTKAEVEPLNLEPGPVHPKLPEVGYGHFSSPLMTPRQKAHSIALARILTALAADNGSSIIVPVAGARRTVKTPEALIEALLESGHKIEMRNERTFANFISLTVGEHNVRWPVWIDTGLELSDKTTLVMPSGHSHHAWRVHGPMLDARVMFYLGTSGAAFFGQVDERPAWTGYRATTTVKSGVWAKDATIVRAIEIAGRYLRRIHAERDTVAKGLPADGYGYLGICNDSNALIELASAGTTSTFPLLRAEELLRLSKRADGLDALFARLPNDGDVSEETFRSEAYQSDALRRALLMTPHTIDSPALWDQELRRQLRLAAESVTPDSGSELEFR